MSARQREILVLVATGLSDKEIAVHLGLSASTVKTYLSRFYRYHGLRNRAQAVALYGELSVKRDSKTPLRRAVSGNWMTVERVTVEMPTVKTEPNAAASGQEVMTHAKTTAGDLRTAGTGRIVSS